MRLAYSSNAFTRHTLSEALNSIAKLGFEGAEILCDSPHWFPDRVNDTEIARTKAQLRDLGLAISNLNANTVNGHFRPEPPENVFEPSLTHPDTETRRLRIDYIRDTLQIAAGVGANCISITSGRPIPGCTPESATDHFVSSLQGLCRMAEDLGLRIGIEYEPGLIVENAKEVREVVDRVGSPNLGVNLDIGHSYLNGEDPETIVALLAGRIWNVHVEDIKDGKHFHLPPGDGDLPFGRYFEALARSGYEGFLTVELYSFPEAPVEVGQRSITFLKPLLGTAGHD